MFQELTNAGFTPVNSGLIMGLLALAKIVHYLYLKNEAASEARHTETRARVDALETHVDECDKDRTTLTGQVAVLTEANLRSARCPKTDCPLRLP